MSLLEPVLHLLADGKFHSDKEISQSLGIPCKIVSEILKRILDPSINLQIVNLRNYRILGGLELLNAAFIQDELGKSSQLLTQVEIVTIVDSTNNYLLEKIGETGNYAVFAEQQTAGRGQFNRQWISSFGKNIYLSLLWHFPRCSNLTGLTLVIGIAIIRALEKYGLSDIQLKWPNDIVHQGKKLGGILIESRSHKTTIHTAVIGIGLNLYYPFSASPAIEQTVTDIYSLQKLPPQRNRLAGLILKNLLYVLPEFQIKGFTDFTQEWQRVDSLVDKPISIQTATHCLDGIARGVNAQGQLCVDIAKKIYYFSSGEVRVRLKENSKNCYF